MKNVIKLFGASLVILATNAFAQSPQTNDPKITGPLTKTEETKFQQFREDNPKKAMFIAQDRRQLEARGLQGKELHRAIHRDFLKMKTDRRDDRIARRQAQHPRMAALADNHPKVASRLFQNRDKIAKNGVTPAQVIHRAGMKRRS